MTDEPSSVRTVLRANARPLDGFSLVVDGKFKTRYDTMDVAQKVGLEIKTKFPALQVMIYDGAASLRTPVELSD